MMSVARLVMPRDFEPTATINYTNFDGTSPYDGVPRSWFQQPKGPGWLWLLGLVASIPIVALFFFDQLFSCILGQKEELGVTRGQYYHSSFLLIGIFNFIFPMLGCPFVTASLPHSPQFVKALTTYDTETGEIIKVNENRIAPIIVYLLCFTALAVPQVLEICPEGVVNGILAFVGIAGILPGTGNQLIDRVVLLFTGPSDHPKDETYTRYVSMAKMHAYTLIQLSCLAICWGMRYTGDFALAFPLVIVLLVPLRLRILPKYFTESELEALDSENSNFEESHVDKYSDTHEGKVKPSPLWL